MRKYPIVTSTVNSAVKLVALALAAAIVHADNGVEDRGWPQSWFEAPKTACEVGITRFSESPFLADRGLPPVAERLPADPIVIEPYQAIGRYGGKAVIMLDDSWQFFNWEAALTLSPDMRGFLPNLAEWWRLTLMLH